ncbi:MAG: serine hydrolase domain-containing protein [Bacteroidota bacterium]
MGRLLDAYEAYGRLSGVALVQKGDSVLLSEAYGCADYAEHLPNQVSSIFNIGSLSKQFTAAAILHLVAEGKVELHAPINSYLSNYASKRWRNVTVHHLLSHTSGIPSLLQFGHGLDHVFPEEDAISLPQLVAYFRDLKLLNRPGKKYSYNNSGYVLLAAIIESVSGKPYGAFMEEHIFQPYGLQHTSHGAPATSMLAHPHYGYGQQQGKAAPLYHESWLIGAGSIFSTVEDLAHWNRIIHQEGFLTPTLQTAYFARHELTNGRNYYAYGWQILEQDGREYHHHDGTIMGYTCDMIYEPQTEVVSILLTNQTHEELMLMGHSEDFIRTTNFQLIKMVQGQEAIALPLPTSDIGLSLAGTYTFAEEHQFYVEENNGEWQVRTDSISPLVFVYQTPIPLSTPLRQRAARAIDGLTQKRFSRFARECDGTMKTLTHLGIVKLGMNSIMKGMGEWQNSVLFEEHNGEAKFRMFCENGTVDFSIYFNEEDKIQGIFDTSTSPLTHTLPASIIAWPVKSGLFIDGFAYGEQDVYLQLNAEGKLVFRQGSRSFESE